jgi:hypothetical protein
VGGLVWNVGVFANRYGGAGRYDAGRYDTYLFGRTHMVGETLTAKLDLTNKLILVLEHGFGAKSDVLLGNPKREMPAVQDNRYLWVPYNGENGQFPALVNHAHVGLVFHTHRLFKELIINGHFIHTFSNSADKNDDPERAYVRHKDGKMMIGGAEVKANGAVFGDAYLGFSTIATDGLNKMPDTVEVLHSQGGWSYLKNYYGDATLAEPLEAWDASGDGNLANMANPGTGRVNTLAWQYMFSFARLLWHLEGKEFWGQGPDLQLSFWGMYNTITPDEELAPKLKRWAKKKLKFGTEAMYTPLKYFGFGMRFDEVMQDLDYDATETSRNAGTLPSYAPYSIVSGKLRLKTAFVTHEEVNIQYSRYFWSGGRSEVRSQEPYVGQPADRNALMLSVNMWW